MGDGEFLKVLVIDMYDQRNGTLSPASDEKSVVLGYFRRLPEQDISEAFKMDSRPE